MLQEIDVISDHLFSGKNKAEISTSLCRKNREKLRCANPFVEFIYASGIPKDIARIF